MGHSAELLDKVEEHLRLTYPGTLKILREAGLQHPNAEKIKHPARTRLIPDLQVLRKDELLCVVEVGDNDADKLDVYLKLRIPDIRWYSKTSGKLVARFDGLNAEPEGRIDVPLHSTARIGLIRNYLKDAELRVDAIWVKTNFSRNMVCWISPKKQHHEIHLYPFADGFWRVALDFVDVQSSIPAKEYQKTTGSGPTMEYTCNFNELKLVIDWLIELCEWYENTPPEKVKEIVSARDLNRLPRTKLSHYLGSNWFDLQYLWSVPAYKKHIQDRRRDKNTIPFVDGLDKYPQDTKNP